MPKHMKIKILVIIFLLTVALATAIFFHTQREDERQFRGTFVQALRGNYHVCETACKGMVYSGNLYKTQKESGFS